MRPAEPDRSRKIDEHLWLACAAVPLLLAATIAHPRDASTLRLDLLGLSIGADGPMSLPIAQLLVPLSTLVPIGSRLDRATVALAIPAALVAALVARRTLRRTVTDDVWARNAIVLATGALAGLLAFALGPARSLVVVAIELGLAVYPAALADLPRALARSLVATACALVAAPSFALVLVLGAVVALAPLRGRGLSRRALGASIVFGAVPFAAALAALSIVRRARSAISLEAVGASLAVVEGPNQAVLRAIVYALVFAAAAAALSIRNRRRASPSQAAPIAPASEDGVSLLIVLVALLHATARESPAYLELAAVVALPVAAEITGAIHLAVAGRLRARETPSMLRRVGAWIVPALLLGLAARAAEETGDRARVVADVRAADGLVPLLDEGLGPLRSVRIIDASSALLDWLGPRITGSLRPDLIALPIGPLFVGGAARMAQSTVALLPASASVLRASASEGAIDESDAAALLRDHPIVADVATFRLRGLMRHLTVGIGAPTISSDRIDPIDRRLARPAIDRRARFVEEALSTRPSDDPLKKSLRSSSLRVAAWLAGANDRDGALASLDHAVRLGLDATRAATLRSRIEGRQPIADDLTTP